MIFTITGEPKGKQRPRFNKMTGVTYTPSETKAYEKRVKYNYYLQGGRKFDGAVKIEVWAFMQIPRSASKKHAEELKGAPCTKKPDVDNVLKAVMDGLSGIAYDDDKQVADAIIHKRYAEEPRVEVDVEEV